MQMITPKSVLKNVHKQIKHMELMKQINVCKCVLMANMHKMIHECVYNSVLKAPSPTIMSEFVLQFVLLLPTFMENLQIILVFKFVLKILTCMQTTQQDYVFQNVPSMNQLLLIH